MEKAMAMGSRTRAHGSRWRWPFMFGVLLLILALATLAYEVIAADGGGYRSMAAGEIWFRLHPSSLNLSQAIVQRYLHPAAWDPVIIGALQWPAWSLLGAPAAVLMFLFGPWKSGKTQSFREG